MTWAKLSDNFHSHPKTLRMGLEANGLYARAISYAACHLTDGFVPREWVATQAPAKVIQRLLDVGALEPLDDGYVIVDFLQYNPSKAEVAEKRRVTRERVTRYRSRTNVVSNGAPDPTRPVPVPELPSIDDELKGNALDVGQFVEQLNDSDEQTPTILRALSRDLPEAAFRTALESLEMRRGREPHLTSETRYFVAALTSMKRERQYA